MLPSKPTVQEIEMTLANGMTYPVRDFKVRHFSAERNRLERCYCALNGALWVRFKGASANRHSWSDWEAVKGRIEAI